MAAQIGTLSQKIDRQPVAETSTPPTTGPQAVATPKMPDQMPMAWARSLGSWNVLRTIDSETGVSIDPPMALQHAQRDERPGVRRDRAQQRAEAEPGEADEEDPLRPSRSAAEPDSSSRDDTTSR